VKYPVGVNPGECLSQNNYKSFISKEIQPIQINFIFAAGGAAAAS
jgi:hypothetical protein